jgi:carbon monoxide dehydrogenase subunit G
MELSNVFTVAVPVDEAWRVITDLERIAPCMPGAQLQEVEGDEYRGIVKIKVGPITAQYKGVASFLQQDPAGYRAVLKAEGRDTRGQGNASATITAQLVAEGDSSTQITVDTDLTITGKVAQFGRGVLADVSTKLIGQFADSLNAELTSGDAGGAAPAADAPADGAADAPAASAPAASEAAAAAPKPAPVAEPEATTSTVATAAPPTSGNGSAPAASTGPRKIDSKAPEPINLLEHAGSPVGKRLAPVVGVVVLVLWLLRRRRKKRK